MEPQTVDQILKEFFKEPRSLSNKLTVAKSRFITGTLTDLSKTNLVKELGYEKTKDALYIKK